MVYLEGIKLRSDKIEDLHRFARRIGLSKTWFQVEPFRHYQVVNPHLIERAFDLGAFWRDKQGKLVREERKKRK